MYLLFAFLSFGTAWAQKSSETYFVNDEKTSVPISECVVLYRSSGQDKKCQTSKNGSFTVDKKVLSVIISHIGYETKVVNLRNLDGKVIELVPKSLKLNEMTVYSIYDAANKGNLYKYDALKAKSTISIIGEPDVLRHISSLPGVSQGIEGSLGLFVRGANNGSNGIYFNDVPIYVSSHWAGLFSVFPSEIVDETAFYLGGLPAEKGNLSSSLLNISTKRDFGGKFSGKVTLSPYLSGIYTNIPIVKDKLTLQVSGRTSFAPYLYPYLVKEKDGKTKIQIYDFTTILDYKVSKKNYINAMFFTTNDYLSATTSQYSNGHNWNSMVGKIGWRSEFNKKLNLNVWSYFSKLSAAQESGLFKNNNSVESSKVAIVSSLRELSLNAKVNYAISNKWQINGGLAFQKQQFKPGDKYSELATNVIDAKKMNADNLISAFGEASFKTNKVVNLRLGYRHTLHRSGEELYSNFDVHFLGHLFFNENFGLEMTFDRLNQYYHVLEGLPIGWSLNITTPSSKEFPAELTHQYYSGLFWKRNSKKMKLNLSLGGYYRDMKNIVSYVNSSNILTFKNSSWEELVDIGVGKSYGLEMSSNVSGERFGATLAYTLSKSDRTYPKINKGATFPFQFDRRHILNIQANYTLIKHTNKKGTKIEHTASGVLAYSSGNRVTLPIANYDGVEPPFWGQLITGYMHPQRYYKNIYDRELMSSKNGFKMKDYLRVDVAYTIKFIGKKRTNELALSVFNVLNRHNPYTYFLEEQKWKQVSIVPIMPSIRWSIRW